MKLNTFAPRKSRAQAMVEFAIVLPLLLLLVYGLLEAGRLLFIYSTIVTATRQASRYGSASGDGTTPGVPRYQDCFGIRQAAQRVDFLNAFEDSDISIAYDGGEGQPVTGFDGICDGNSDSGVTPSPNNDTRIVVTINGNYFPIVPRIVPFLERSNANSNPISATSARTIIIGISIEVTSPPGSGPPPPGTFDLTIAMTATPSTYMFAGEVINLSYNVTNSGSVDLSGIVLTPTHGPVTCPGTALAVGASMTCTGSFTITPADIIARTVLAQATATATDGTSTITSNTATVTLTFVELPELTLAKSASTEYAREGSTIVYSFTLTNSGNVTLSPPYTVTDNLTPVTCPAAGDLAPGASLGCTANYVVRPQDVSDDELVNTAAASAMYGTQTINSNQSSATVWTGPLFLQASVAPASVSAPGTVTYSYQLINNTGVILNPPYILGGHRGSENCSTNASQIAIGGSITCTGTYTVQQGDLDSNASLVNNIQATACAPGANCSGPRLVSSNSDSVTVTMVRNPALSMTLVSATPNPATTAGTTVTFTYTLTNTGNVTLTSATGTIAIRPNTDAQVVNRFTCVDSSPPGLAPGESQTCTVTYSITQQDIEDGSITAYANASATFNSETVRAVTQAYPIATFVGPRLRLQITPNPTTYTGVGQFIVYTYTLRNTGSVPLYGPYVITDNRVTFVDCAPATSPLTVGGSTSCVGSYATTQTDMNAGNIINSASATGSDGTQIVTSNSAMAVVYVPGAPTLTPSPTNTGLPVPTQMPTTGPTAVTGCGNITATNITTPGTTMTMTINNPNSYTVTVSTVAVTWNPTGGNGNPNTLTLQSAQWSGTTFWTGSNASGSLSITPSTTLTLPGNSSRIITFNFDKNYVSESGESITINLSTPGCGSTPIRKP